YHAPDFLVPPDDWIQLAPARQLGEIASVPLESLIRAFGILVRHALRTADAGERLKDRVARHAVLLQPLCARGAAAFVGEDDEEMLRADVLVFEALGFGLRLVGDQLQARRHARLRAAVRLRQLLQQLASPAGDDRRIDVHLPQQFGDDALALLDERDEEMLRLELRIVALPRQLDRGGDGLSRFFGVFIDVHKPLQSRRDYERGPQEVSSRSDV